MSSDHDRTVRTEFRRQSPTFEGDDSFFADPRLAAWVARHLAPLESPALVLEVACGAAHQAEAIAPRVARVVGVDLTPEMLAVARHRLRDRAVDRVTLARADAARLPFPDGSFDVTFCRFAVHHFAD
ncbi:MAG TPA: class I SAM-dependent methyltransferase, partial [Acidimicrobiia bacterium]|nr:class I SAM-dependent methyltransferase [Acidimicrobiia bacterium]